MLLATPGLNPGKAYQIGMLSDMVLHRGVRPGHSGMLPEVAMAKQRETSSCPGLTQQLGWFLESAFCSLDFRLKSSQGSVH